MPALNEEDNVKEAIILTLEAFNNNKIRGEIILVNDGSNDKTLEIVQNNFNNFLNIRILNHKKTMGIGYSFFEGVSAANGEVVVLFPSDGENDPDATMKFLDLINDVDIIVPFTHNIEVRERFRRILSSLYRFIINISFGVNLNYTNGTVYYRKCILKDINLKSSNFFYQAELLVKLIRRGYLFAEVPNFLFKRKSGSSKAIRFKSLFNIMQSYLTIFIEIHIKRIDSHKVKKDLHPESATFKIYNNLKN